jgi:hypothetical protein
VTELFYDDCCFDTRCLEAFRRYSGHADWPRNDDGGIDRFDPVLGNWRSLQVAAITSRLAYAARAERKRYLMDVRVSRESLDRNSAENGQDYMTLLPLVDQLVVWDYFALEGRWGRNDTGIRSACGRRANARWSPNPWSRGSSPR